MNKLSMGLLLIMFTSSGYSSVIATPSQPGLSLGLTGLYWRASTNHLDHALTYPLDAFVPFVDGDYQSIDNEYGWNYKANIGYIFPQGKDVTLTYTHFDEDDTKQVPNPGQLFPTLTNDWLSASPFTAATTPPFTVVATISIFTLEGTFPAGTLAIASPINTTFASAKTEFKADVLDLDLGQSLCVNRAFSLRWYAGLRYASLEHKFNASYFGEAAGVDSLSEPVLVSTDGLEALITVDIDFALAAEINQSVNQKSDFKGIGPRFGVDSRYELGGGFGFIGGMSLALLVGELDSSLFNRVEGSTTATITAIGSSLTAPDGITLVIDDTTVGVGSAFFDSTTSTTQFTHPDETRIVPNIDAKLGLDYSCHFANTRTRIDIEAGWMVCHFFNSVDRLTEFAPTNPEFRSRQITDTSFDGPYIGVQVTV